MKNYIKAILSLSSVGMLFYIIFNQKEQIKTLNEKPDLTHQVDSLIKVKDSLDNELFIKHTEADRYEIALDRLREVSPKSAEEFDLFLSTTE